MTRPTPVLLYLLAFTTALATFVPAIAPEASDAARHRPTAGSEVVNGWDVPPGQYPFVAGIGSADPSGAFLWDNQFCGGSLITPSSVLTAAHCMVGRSADQVVVVVGRTIMSSTEGEVRHVASISVHPEYDPKQTLNDLAVLRLRSPITNITPIRVIGTGDQSFDSAGSPLTLVGWGDMRAGPHPGKSASWPDQMQQTQLSVVSDATCAKQWRRTGYKNASVWPTILCTNPRKFGSGDSGGPVFATVNGTFVQVSLVSGSFHGQDKKHEHNMKKKKNTRKEKSLQKHVPDFGPQLSAPISADFINSVIG